MLHQKLNPYFAILFITLIGSVIAYWLVWQSTTLEVEDSLPVAVQHRIPSTTSNGIDTSTWKTYRSESEEYDFEVKYPPKWIATTVTGGVLVSEKPPVSEKRTFISFTSEVPYDSAESYKNLEDFRKNFHTSDGSKGIDFATQCNSVSFSGTSAYDCFPDSAFQGGGRQIFFLDSHGYLFNISDYIQNDTSKEILSTFTFIK